LTVTAGRFAVMRVGSERPIRGAIGLVRTVVVVVGDVVEVVSARESVAPYPAPARASSTTASVRRTPEPYRATTSITGQSMRVAPMGWGVSVGIVSRGLARRWCDAGDIRAV
jgi:hypothetical protein